MAAGERQCRDYLERHRIPELLHRLGALLLYHRPGAAPQGRAGPLWGLPRREKQGNGGEGGCVAFGRLRLWVILLRCRKTTRVPDPGAGKGEGWKAGRGGVPLPHGRGQPGRHVPAAGRCGARPHHGGAVQGRCVSPEQQTTLKGLYLFAHGIITMVSKPGIRVV